MFKKIAWIVGGLALAGFVGYEVWVVTHREKGPRFREVTVDSGDVTATVTATGTLSAVTTVKVGSQVSGIVSKLHVDFNSQVRRGQLLAELDPTTYQAQVDQRRADVDRARVELRNAKLSFERSRSLLAEKLVSQSEFDAAQLGLESAAAALAQSEAQMRQSVTNLGYTRIVSPIDGVVVERQYDVGQTVAASFQAPTLFTIAQDLTKMQVSINVDEADVGRVKVGQAARFTVDAFPDATFEGRISQVRLAPATVNNVVTYPVLVDVANPEMRLKPGMTANVQVPVETRTAVLRVPNAALRFRPDPADLADDGKSKGKAGEAAAATKGEADGKKGPDAAASASPAGERRGGEGRPGMGASAEGRPGGRGGRGEGRGSQLWVLDAATGKLKGVPVKTGITDGNVTVVEGDGITEGMKVVAGLATSKAMEQSGGLTGGPMGGGGRRGGGRGF